MQLFTNNATSVLAAGITNVATSLTVAAGEGAKFPAITGGDYFLATLCQLSGATEINHEIVKVSARTTDTFTIVRAQEGTTARAFNAADPVQLRVTAGTVTALATLGANTFTAAQDHATGAAIASAATINLDTATGNRVHITGTTTITAVTLTRGPRTVIFDGALTLTHHATNNNLPGGVDIPTAAGDRAVYESDGTTVYCTTYTPANGTAVVGTQPGQTLLSTVVAASSATVDMETTFDSTYDDYIIKASDVALSTTAQLLGTLKLGGAYASSAYRYHLDRSASNGATYNGLASDSAANFPLGITVDATGLYNFTMHVSKPTNTTNAKAVYWEGVTKQLSTTFIAKMNGIASNDALTALTGIRFAPDTGLIASGTFRLYGIKKA